MFDEFIWIPTQAASLLFSGGVHRAWSAWAGYAVLLSAALLLFFCVRAAITLKLVKAVCWFFAAFFLFISGSALAVQGTHFARGQVSGEASITGAQVVELSGPASADLGTLVIIGGLGSESPAFCEPAVFRQPVADSADSIASRFRKRVIIRLWGGFGWNDFARTEDIAVALDHWLERNASAWGTAGRFNAVVAHSRGAHVLACTSWFRAHAGWRRVAVHPASGINLPFRMLDFMAPEIAEVERTGQELMRKCRYGGGKTYRPWDSVWQARGWDFLVQRFPADTGLDLRNTDPFASHVTPGTRRDSAFWTAFEAELPRRK